MIPKIIHYCWFGGNPLPTTAKKCIASWRKYFPDYEIKEWNESNFNVNIIPYTAEAYKAKKYAFVSDFARFWIIYNYGGVYFDTDVEVLQSLEDIIEHGAFMGLQKMSGGDVCWAKYPIDNGVINPGLGIGAAPGSKFAAQMLNFYSHKHFISLFGAETGTVVHFTTNLLYKIGLKKHDDGTCSCEDITIYPDEYFDPMNYYTGEVVITPQTRSFHHYTATWVTKKTAPIQKRIYLRLCQIFLRIKVSFKRLFDLRNGQ